MQDYRVFAAAYRSNPPALTGGASENGNGDDQKFRRASRQGENRLKRFRSEEGDLGGEEVLEVSRFLERVTM